MKNTVIVPLIPKDNRKSFYGKAYVLHEGDTHTLYSYNTPVLRRECDGSLTRLWSGWSATTGRHINAFCGIGKREWDKMEVYDI